MAILNKTKKEGFTVSPEIHFGKNHRTGVQIDPPSSLFRVKRRFSENKQASATTNSCEISKFFRTATLKENCEYFPLYFLLY